MWVIVFALASCQKVAEKAGPGEPMAESSAYPSLHTVPPRPQLSYTIEQRRAVVDGLIADREHARYNNQVVRYRTGLSGLRPPDAPPVAAAAPTVAPDGADVADMSPSARAARERPVVDPETEPIYEDDEDLDSFLEGLAGARTRAPGEIAPGPESNAAPLARTIVRAGAARPVSSPATGNDRPPPGVVWAIPAETAGLPDAPRPREASASGTHQTTPPPAAAGPAVPGRAPGVVWGMVDRSDGAARPAATSTAQAADGRGAPAPASAVARAADAPASTDTTDGNGQRPLPTETAMTGRAPGVVWGMVDLPDRPAGPAAPASGSQMADPTAAPAAAPVPRTSAAARPIQTNGQNRTIDRQGSSAEPALAMVAERSGGQPPLEPDAADPGIEVDESLITVAPASGAERAQAVETIAFTPGSASLPPDAAAHLERFLAELKAPDARIRVVGEADAPGLALDRAVAVGVALVQRGVPAHRLELTRAQDATGDQARLVLAPSAP